MWETPTDMISGDWVVLQSARPPLHGDDLRKLLWEDKRLRPHLGVCQMAGATWEETLEILIQELLR